MNTLELIGNPYNWCIFIIFDYGDMIGERGMVYKFNPHEGSFRVLMIAMSPGFSRGS